MIIIISLAIALGVASGIFTGLIPGIHVNLVSILALSVYPVFSDRFPPIIFGVYIISLAITHSFLDSIPSIYLGAPDASTALNVLPGHKLLLEGKGHLAVKMTLIGSLLSLLLGSILFPIFIIGMNFLYPLIKNHVGYILIIVMLYMILKEKGLKKFFSFIAFIFSGILGLLVLNYPSLSQPLFPLLSGLFGVSILLTSISDNSEIPNQKSDAESLIKRSELMRTSLVSTITGFFAAFLPGLGSAQAAIIAQNFAGKIKQEGFLCLVGGINTANMLISIATAYTLDKARNGAIVVVKKILEVDLNTMIIFLLACIIAGSFSVMLGLVLSKKFSSLITKISYRNIAVSIIILILFLSIVFDGFIGLLILIVSVSLGIFSTRIGVGKNHLMGCLIIPVILYFI